MTISPSRRASRRSERTLPKRDQDTSSFTRLLQGILLSTPGAIAAALVDFEGETVDYAGAIDPFEIKVAAAHWLIVMSEIGSSLGGIREISVRADRRGFHIREVHTGYAVVIILHRYASFAVSARAMTELDIGLAREAGWPRANAKLDWYGVQVQTARDDQFRPQDVLVDGVWKPIEVMGALVGLARAERGFRVRFSSGHELMLLRERFGRWFADEKLP
jgi:hypothetical protein